jgi:hypothetical protein
VSLSLSLSSTFIHLHFALNLSLSSLVVRISFSPNSPCSFLFSPAFRQYPALLPSIHSVFKLCRSFFRFHSQPIPLALFPHMEPGVSLSTPSTPISHTHPTVLFVCFPHYLFDMCLIRGSYAECVTHSFPSFPVPLILFTLPFSLVEHHHFRLLNIHFQLFLLHNFFHFFFALCHNYRRQKSSCLEPIG